MADIEADMRRDMMKELRRMARSYTGKARETREVLQAIVIAETEGITVEDLADVLGEILAKLEKTAV